MLVAGLGQWMMIKEWSTFVEVRLSKENSTVSA